jgi:hypothetical protein
MLAIDPLHGDCARTIAAPGWTDKEGYGRDNKYLYVCR